MVSVRTRIPADALTAPVLGTERAGHGVVLDAQGTVLTIGYLVTEAESVWLVDHQGNTVPGHVVGYDQETGLGIVQALARVSWPYIELGESAQVIAGQPVVVAGHGGAEDAVHSLVIGVREFAGYWEYVLDHAIFTAPAHPNWGGTGMLGEDGRLLGIGSLLVQHVTPKGDAADANMIVPIDVLKPIYDDLLRFGRRNEPARPWVGWLVQETGEGLAVAGVYDGCPADNAGVQPGDRLTQVAGEQVDDLANMFNRVWSLGEAGIEVPITIERDSQVLELRISSIDRSTKLRSGPLH